MAKHKLFLREIFRIWAQWFGIGLASIAAGITIGILLRNGVSLREARAIGLSVGFVLALAFWVLIGRMFVVRPVECARAMTATIVGFDSRANGFAPAFAAAVVCLSLYTSQHTLPLHSVTTLPITDFHALPKY